MLERPTWVDLSLIEQIETAYIETYLDGIEFIIPSVLEEAEVVLDQVANSGDVRIWTYLEKELDPEYLNKMWSRLEKRKQKKVVRLHSPEGFEMERPDDLPPFIPDKK